MRSLSSTLNEGDGIDYWEINAGIDSQLQTDSLITFPHSKCGHPTVITCTSVLMAHIHLAMFTAFPMALKNVCDHWVLMEYIEHEKLLY